MTALQDAVRSAGNTLAFSSRDWADRPGDAWLWGILLGWDDESLADIVKDFGWSPAAVADLKRYRAAVVELMGDSA